MTDELERLFRRAATYVRYSRGVDPRVRFLANVRVNQLNDCWIWTGADDGRGYGVFTPNGRGTQVKAYVYAYRAFRGEEVPKGLHLLHECENTICVNPWHVNPGTRSENMQMAAGAIRVGMVEAGATSIVGKPEAVAEIQRLYLDGHSQGEIARILDVSQATVSRACKPLGIRRVGNQWGKRDLPPRTE